ncbi:MAG: RepB plasmid partitioning protein [bacterium ADurb.Bin429]|nr:MAG: RepB plasmid partitioning protein [bacterium ADurb.Bin429]
MSDQAVKLGFALAGHLLPMTSLLPTRLIDDRVKKSNKYATLMASIDELGIIEPPVVYALPATTPAQYLLLDGHLRVEALKELGHETVYCLLSTDDEGYTYNHKVNRLVPIQEHFMIMKALERGVSEERIARALKLDVQSIRLKRYLLNGICPEAVELLKDKPIGAASLQVLRKVKPARQVEIAEMMNMVGNYGRPYCEALVAATPKELLVEQAKTRAKSMLSPDEVARMQREMETLQRDLHLHEDTYSENFLNLVLIRGYLKTLLNNPRIARHLTAHYPEFAETFQHIIASTSLEETP